MTGHQLPIVHYLNGTFLIFKADQARQLRRRRIMNRPLEIDAATNGPPYCISHYAAHVAATHGLAQFVHMIPSGREISLEHNRAKVAERIEQEAQHEQDMHMMRRMAELRRLNLPTTPKNLGNFDKSKARLTISETLDRELIGSYDEQLLSETQVQAIIMRDHQALPGDIMRMRVYHDLYERGFYISSGLKFGCDFLAYMGDPVRYHAQYAIKLVDGDERGCVDLKRADYVQINSLQRLTHTAGKIPLFATVDTSPLHRVRYWTLKERVYLDLSSSSDSALEQVEPRIEVSSYEQIKIRRTA